MINKEKKNIKIPRIYFVADSGSFCRRNGSDRGFDGVTNIDIRLLRTYRPLCPSIPWRLHTLLNRSDSKHPHFSRGISILFSAPGLFWQPRIFDASGRVVAAGGCFDVDDVGEMRPDWGS